MRWTRANERTVKNWISGTHGPSGEHLLVLACHSDAVMNTIYVLTNRDRSSSRLEVVKQKLHEALQLIDGRA